MSASQLGLYNGALLLCGERALTSLTEAVESRRLLDAAWDDDAVRYCLEQGLWNFATRAVQLDFTPSVSPEFGYRRAFDKPTDYVRVVALCSDEYFNVPLTQYVEEASYFFCDLDIIYLRYVSDDTSYGNDLSLWPPSFTQFVEAYLASKIVYKLTASERAHKRVEDTLRRRRIDAKSKDAMNDPTPFPAVGVWVRARRS